ncbi:MULTISPECIES: hypothetical protein [unclassified Dolichospermum]|uniref:methylation-associated defense system protein MAD7 n=1 Tax=unclassified Dolichospermum TaxID=2622029 RepID=UPI001444F649|nr:MULTISPECIES: hypothetical protein [unclassified Dolichospermum]MTJ16678.1 hypothetical protein [Dolichospermum sp. UHCC 0299]MTJ21334.1 hypothetical protein [Dolichospermum sp. UHCC 0352]MTJ39298.1 hypothetical protein [Dolichospermum sp. UHCC 0406]
MGLDNKKDKDFALDKISYVNFKHIEIDRTLLNLFPRLKFDGYPSRVRNSSLLFTVEKFLEEFIDDKNQSKFIGFAEHKDIVSKWLETDLLDLANRGKSNQAVVSPRPLHGNAYKYRNTKYAKDEGSSEQIYWMIYYARKGLGQAARDALKDFIFAGLDQQTDLILLSDQRIDVETQAILHFDKQVKKDAEDRSKEPERYSPLCIGQADLLADDILRLLTYENYMPRSVLVDYLKTLLSFHLALYHLRLMKLLPALVKRRGSDPTCDRCPVNPRISSPHGDCPHRIGLVVDMGDPTNPHMTELARHSADSHYRRIPGYIEAHFITKKLDEMAEYLRTRNKLSPAGNHFSVGEVLQLLHSSKNKEREDYFKSRVTPLIERYQQGAESSIPPEVQRIINMNLGEFDTYIEIILALRGSYHREAIIKCLDAFLLKNSDLGLLRQSRAKGSPRWFALGSRLLEVLLQIAVLEPQGTSFVTREIRVDELLTLLRDRYGLYIDRLPPGDGFGQPSIVDQQALRKNVTAFKTRLREIGFFQDLSDAYVTQTVTPRYTITTDNSGR